MKKLIGVIFLILIFGTLVYFVLGEDLVINAKYKNQGYYGGRTESIFDYETVKKGYMRCQEQICDEDNFCRLETVAVLK